MYLELMGEGMEHDTSFPKKDLIELPSVNLQASTRPPLRSRRISIDGRKYYIALSRQRTDCPCF